MQDVPVEEEVFNFLCVALAFSGSYGFGVVWPLPILVGWHLDMGNGPGVRWLEDVVKPFVHIAACLGFEESFKNCLFGIITGESCCGGLFLKKHGSKF
jgi:hypothetical protein